ncbi:MAG: hypothetical protein QOD06_544 [Candidatus Binatota bacterium]|jgi:TRAP-type C4-dicarboxylate transport system permease small subunit|nr:hypothetical protein [Candidatus Binatota bacterium]
MAEHTDDSPGVLERARRVLAWLAGALFVISFLGLLALSATSYWTADNPWVTTLDQVWKGSGLVALALGCVPYGVAGARRARRLLTE